LHHNPSVIVVNGKQSAMALEARRAELTAVDGGAAEVMEVMEARRVVVVKKFASKVVPNATRHLLNVASGTAVEAKRAARRAAGMATTGIMTIGMEARKGGMAARKEARRAAVLALEAVPNACLSAILLL